MLILPTKISLQFKKPSRTTCFAIITTHANQIDKLKDAETNQHCIVLPEFDLSTRIIGFGNGSNRVTAVAYEVKYHPAHSTLLKSLLIKSSVIYPLPPTDTNIHFIPHGLIQATDVTTVTNQITQ